MDSSCYKKKIDEEKHGQNSRRRKKKHNQNGGVTFCRLFSPTSYLAMGLAEDLLPPVSPLLREGLPAVVPTSWAEELDPDAGNEAVMDDARERMDAASMSW